MNSEIRNSVVLKFDFFSGIVLYDLLLLWVLNRKSLIQGSLNWIKAKCPASNTLVSSWRIQGVGRGGGGGEMGVRPDTYLRLNWLIFSNETRVIQKCNCFGYPPVICSPLLAKQYFPCQRLPAFTDWQTRGRLCFLSCSMATTRPI